MPPMRNPRPTSKEWSRRRLCQAMFAGMLVPTLTACTQPVRLPLTVGSNAWVGYDPLALARDQHLFDTQRIKVVGLSSSSETLRYLRNGLLDAGALTLDEALRLNDEGFDVRVVALLDASTGADVVMGDPSVRQLADLKGRAVAVESTTVGALMLRRLLKAGGMTTGDIQAVHLEATQHLDALRAGRVIASVSYEPIASVLREAGYGKLFDSADMPGDIVDVLVVRNLVLKERPDDVAALVAGWNRGLQAFLQEPEEVARIMGPASDLSPQDYLKVLGQLHFIDPQESLRELSGSPPRLAQSSGPLSTTLQEMGLIRQAPDWAGLVDTGPAMAALAMGDKS